MKTKTILRIMITAVILFIVMSIISAVKIWQAKKSAAELSRIGTLYEINLQKISAYEMETAKLKVEITILTGEKATAEIELRDYKADIQKKIKDYEAQIAGLKELPADTVYSIIFNKYPTMSGILKYRFAENQIRNIHLDMVERDQYFTLYNSTNKALDKCGEINIKNDEIIINLGSQNQNLSGQNTIFKDQLTIKNDELAITNKLLNKQKRKAFLFKSTTVIGSIGWLLFVLK